MTAPTKKIAAGGKYTFIGFLDSDSNHLGGTIAGPSAGASNGFALLEGLKTASPATPAPEVVSITGDDDLLGEFSFDSIEQRTFVADFAVHSSALDAAMLGVNVRSVAGANFVGGDIRNAPQRTAVIIFNGRSKSKDSGSSGLAKWTTKIVLAAQVTPLGRTAFTEREGAVYQLSISPQLAAYDLPGITIVASVHGTDGMRYDNADGDYPFHAQPIQGNGSQTTFNLDYAPISTSYVLVTVNRVQVSVASVSASAKTITLSSAPANGAKGIVLYGFNG